MLYETMYTPNQHNLHRMRFTHHSHTFLQLFVVSGQVFTNTRPPHEGQNEAVITILSIEASPHGLIAQKFDPKNSVITSNTQIHAFIGAKVKLEAENAIWTRQMHQST